MGIMPVRGLMDLVLIQDKQDSRLKIFYEICIKARDSSTDEVVAGQYMLQAGLLALRQSSPTVNTLRLCLNWGGSFAILNKYIDRASRNQGLA